MLNFRVKNIVSRKQVPWLPSITIVRKCCSLIAFTSAIDAFLAFHYRESILDLEQNPVCLMLMEIEPRFLSAFLAGKLLGTGLTILVTIMAHRLNSRIGVGIAVGLSIFQLGLLGYQLLA